MDDLEAFCIKHSTRCACSKSKTLFFKFGNHHMQQVKERRGGASGIVTSRLRATLRLPAHRGDASLLGKEGDPATVTLGDLPQVQVSEGSVAVTKNRRKQGLPPKFRDCYLDYQSDDESDGETFSESEDEAQRVTSGDAEHVIKQEPISDEESSFTEDNKQEDHEAKTKFTLDNVQVKEEPFNLIINDDCGAKASDPSSSPEPDKMVQSQSISKPKSRRRQASNFSVPVNESQVSGSDIPVKTGPAQSGKAAARAGSGTSGSTINSVVDLLSLRCELSVAQSRNAELETRLDDARSEIARLSDVVSTRETQIKNLANSFFDLSERFMSAAAEFKRVVHSVNQGDNQ